MNTMPYKPSSALTKYRAETQRRLLEMRDSGKLQVLHFDDRRVSLLYKNPRVGGVRPISWTRAAQRVGLPAFKQYRALLEDDQGQAITEVAFNVRRCEFVEIARVSEAKRVGKEN